MSKYAIFFDKDGVTYRLPTNPEAIDTTSVQAIEKYEILKLGQIAIPSHMELKVFSFECELPKAATHYVETSMGFKEPSFYIDLFSKWRDRLEPVRFIASNGTGDDINTLALMEELSNVEKAGEEGDKYIRLSLLEYRPFGKRLAVIKEEGAVTAPLQRLYSMADSNPKSTGYHVVQSGDTLWAIAKQYYGDGSKCNIVFNANKDKIKKPALIQPGWKLRIPTKDEFSKFSAALPSGIKSKEKAKAVAASFVAEFTVGTSGGGGGRGGGGAF